MNTEPTASPTLAAPNPATAGEGGPDPSLSSEPSGQPSASAPPSTQPQTPDAEASAGNHTRKGKVARLPKEVRDQVNQMLLDGVPFGKIIAALGDKAQDVTERNVSNWKQGGYEDWLLDLERKEALAVTRDAALELVSEKAGATVQDAGRTIAAAQLYELLLSFNPTSFTAALADKPELYLKMIGALARLSEGEAACSNQRVRETQIKAKLDAAKPGAPANVITQETLKEIARLIKLL